MKATLLNLPVHVFFDKEGFVTSFQYPEKEFLHGLTQPEFEQVTESFVPVHPSPKISPGLVFAFPVKGFLTDEGTIYSLKTGTIDNIYGKTKEQVEHLAKEQHTFLRQN